MPPLRGEAGGRPNAACMTPTGTPSSAWSLRAKVKAGGKPVQPPQVKLSYHVRTRPRSIALGAGDGQPWRSCRGGFRGNRNHLSHRQRRA